MTGESAARPGGRLRAPRPALLAFLALVLAAPAPAATRWLSIGDLDGGRTVCLDVGGQRFDYTALGAGDDATCTVQGPRRLKLIARYLYQEDEASRQPYTIVVAVDGREVLRKSFTARPLASVGRCGEAGRVSSLRKGYVEVPTGEHRITITCASEGAGPVAVRLFREVKRTRSRWIPFAPEVYAGIRELEFASGSRSTYYALDTAQPLRMTVQGPTTLRVRSRLDFDHLMSGSQTYTLEVRHDGEVWRTFHFDTSKLETAVYVDRPDILPGSRREFTIAVPRGRHDVSIHCVRPEACGVAVSVDIPRRDLER